MSCVAGCPTCAPAKPACAARSRRSTPSSPTVSCTSNSPTTLTASSPSCATRPTCPASRSANACCGWSSKTSSSAPTRSPSVTASRSATTPTPATPTLRPRPPRRATIAQVIHCVGGVVSPLLANIYLHRLDRAWSSGQHGVLVRFADDVVVMCRSRGQAEAALERLTALLAELGLKPKAAKTRVVQLAEGEEGFDFLGFHHRLVRGRTPRSAHLTFLARWPAPKAVQRARDRIREITGRRWLWMPVEDIVRDLNLFLRGWANYFRYGNSARVLGQIRNYALQRLATWLSKKGNRRRAWRWGLKQLLLPPNQMGLISLDGTVVAPRPFRDWRGQQGTERRR